MKCALPTRSLLTLGILAAAAGLPAQAASEWVTIENLPPVIGADGRQHEATCSAYPGTDPSYRFWVRPGNPSKLAVVFDGGGACWNDATCSFPSRDLPKRSPLLQFYTPDIPAGVDPSQYGGLLDFGNPGNPVRDWTVVTVPYCTGDVHLGSIDRAYTTVGHPKLPAQLTIRHRGFDNFMVVLNWISSNVPQGVTDLFVTGASAGAYGAAAHFPWLAQQYPQARLSVLADAGQGVTTPGFESGTPGRGSWNVQLAPWVFGSDPSGTPSSELVRKGAQAYANGRFAQYTTAQDSVQTSFYLAMKIFNGPGAPGSCQRVGPDWNNQMLATLADYRASLANFRSFVLPGTSHTIIADPSFFADNAAGVRMSAWLQGMLSSDPGWTYAACPDCLTPLPCH
jgi:hypothetical protein